MVVAWLVFGALLVLFELHHLAFYALFGTVGSLAAAGVALVAPSAVGSQAAVAIAVALAGVVAVRPLISRAFANHSAGPVALGVHGGLAGQVTVTLDNVAGAHHVGHVRLAGERWLAVSGDGSRIAAGTAVVVAAVQGTTLVVWPIEGAPDGVLSGLSGADQRNIGEAPDGADRREQ